MRVRLIGSGAAMLLLAACGGGGGGGGNNGAMLTNNVAAASQGAGANDAQARVQALPEGQRNAVLIRAIRDANLVCQQVTQSSQSQTSNNLPVYMATCEDGAVYAVAIAGDGNATVQPVTPARGR
jgi:hypothetical protein